MNERINRLLERAAELLAKRPGALVLVAVVLVVVNFLLQIVPGSGYWLVDSNVCLHAGVVVGLIGVLLIRALS